MRLLLATTNHDKLKEYRQLFRGHKITLKHLSRKLEVAETGKSFKENALIKAKAYGKKFGVMTVCDDTGLEIKSLNNFPGIKSARFANGNFPSARKEILRRLQGKTDRRAKFTCVLALYLPDCGKVKTFSGTVSGRIALKSQGKIGFGYDPIFIYPGAKAEIGHRAKATRKLIAYLVKLTQ